MPGRTIFERHLPSDRSLLIGHVDDAETPFADLLQQRVGADHGPGAFGGRWNERLGDFRRGRFQKIADFRLGAEQSFDTPTQVFVACASLIEVGTPFSARRFLECGEVDLVDARRDAVHVVDS